MTFDETLSDDAKAIASQFHTLTVMTFHMVESRPSDRYQAGLDELIARNMLTVEPYNQFGGLSYRKVEDKDFSPYVKWMFENPDKGKFPITTKIEDDNGKA